jgi:hypothetical protein
MPMGNTANKSTDEAQLDVMVHMAECLYHFLTDAGTANLNEDEASETMTNCQTMALLISRSMGLEVTSVEEDGIVIRLNLTDPVEYLDSAINS